MLTGYMDGTVRVWNADGSGEPVVLRDQISAVTSVAFSPDGNRVIIGSADGTARVWDVDGSDASTDPNGL